MYYLWLLWCCNGSIESLQQRLSGSRSLKYLLASPSQETFANPWPMALANSSFPSRSIEYCLGVEWMANTLRWAGLKQPTSMGHNSQMHLTVSHALKVQKKKKNGEKAEMILMSFLQLLCGIEAAEYWLCRNNQECPLCLQGPEQTRTKNDPWASYRIWRPRTLRDDWCHNRCQSGLWICTTDQVPMHNCLQQTLGTIGWRPYTDSFVHSSIPQILTEHLLFFC